MVVYVLELKNSKFYIGSTSDLCKTIDEHVAKTFCEWTRINEYQDVFETFEGDRSDENKTVIRYMDKHGVDNVRGGMYKNTVLTFEEHLGIRKSIHYNFSGYCKIVICLFIFGPSIFELSISWLSISYIF